jgi:outer membrane murein-binding lipoprotein Lpp
LTVEQLRNYHRFVSSPLHYAYHDAANARRRIEAVATLLDREHEFATSAEASEIATDLAKLEAKIQRLSSRKG